MVQGQLEPEDLSIAGAAKALAEWHLNCRCCGHCGSSTDIKDGGWRRRCFACGKEFFPRTDPVVIMLVTHGDKCLLSHEPRFKSIGPRMFSTLAGFLEPGEDIEHAVRREVREEVGIEIGAVRYQESQPWPFPHSLMIGCRAEALTDRLSLDPVEIEEAFWASRDEVRQALEGRHPNGVTLPGKHAIARKLLSAFATESG
jgi:NAD+ diphosphatase